ncbi:MAG TPA: DUF1697 domain-containing protein [Candidatus Saccharimonadales bacterium]
MTTYLALLRGVNVGGNNMVKMSDLVACLTEAGFQNVHTFIQSGNVFFDAASTDHHQVGQAVERAIEKRFTIQISVAVFTKDEWHEVVNGAPKWWGTGEGWKHDLFVAMTPDAIDHVWALVERKGGLQNDVEHLAAGKCVMYASMVIAKFSRTTASKLAGTPVYKELSIRNNRTTRKLLDLF